MNRLAETLVFIEFNNKGISNSTLAAITASKKISSDVIGLMFGGSDHEKSLITNYLGNTIVVGTPEGSKYSAESYAPSVANILKITGATKLIAGVSSVSRDLFGRAAAMCKAAVITEVINIDNKGECIRPVHAGNALVKVVSLSKITFYTIRQTAFSPPPPIETKGIITDSGIFTTESTDSEVIDILITSSDKPSLNEAKVVIGCGRGIGKIDFLNGPVEELAKLLKAAVGGTRATCDLGYISNELQIGQTGKVIAPDLYIALGVSGAIQHIAGIRDAKKVVAINSNELAPIFDASDFGIVDRVENVLPQLIAELARLAHNH